MKRIWIVLIVGLVLFLAFIPRFLLYPDYKILGWLVYGLIFGLAPYLVFQAADTFDIKNKDYWRVILGCLTPLLLGPGFGLFHEHQKNKELDRVGLWATAVVVDVDTWKRRNTIKCKYIVEGRTLETTYIADRDKKYVVGDTIRIIYSADYPKICELEYRWKKE